MSRGAFQSICKRLAPDPLHDEGTEEDLHLNVTRLNLTEMVMTEEVYAALCELVAHGDCCVQELVLSRVGFGEALSVQPLVDALVENRYVGCGAQGGGRGASGGCGGRTGGGRGGRGVSQAKAN